MSTFNYAVEDDLSEAVLKRVLGQQRKRLGRRYPDPRRYLSSPGKDFLKTKVEAYNNFAAIEPFIMLVDLDRESCAPVALQKWQPRIKHPAFFLRFVVREIEAWLIADRKGLGHFLRISSIIIPTQPESIDDPKETLISLAKRSPNRRLRQSIVPEEESGAKIGPDYNGALIPFVLNSWDLDAAAQQANSLQRLLSALNAFS